MSIDFRPIPDTYMNSDDSALTDHVGNEIAVAIEKLGGAENPEICDDIHCVDSMTNKTGKRIVKAIEKIAENGVDSEDVSDCVAIRHGGMRKYALPDGFGWSAPINIYTDGVGNAMTDFDAANFKNTGGTTWYVDTVHGNNNNSGDSRFAPKKLFNAAYDKAADGDTIIYMNDGASVIHRDASTANRTITKSINIISEVKKKMVCADVLAYTLHSGHVYSATRSNVVRVVDFSYDDMGIEYDKKASIAECESNPGSWYQSGSTLYVRTIDGAAPDNDMVFALLASGLVSANNSTSGINLYIENLELVGGTAGNCQVQKRSETNDAPTFAAKNCRFLYGNSDDAVALDGVSFAAIQNCEAAFAALDGFNYHAKNGTTPKFIEVGCIGHDNGRNTGTSDNTYNGSTCHDGVLGIRVNGLYYNNVGSNVADVHVGTKTVNVCCGAFDSRATTDTGYSADFNAQQSGAEMWIHECDTSNSVSAFGLYATSDTTMHVHRSRYARKGGGGTYDIV